MTPHEFHALRLSLGQTQSELGRQLGKHRNTIGDFESGKRPIPLAIARLLAYLLAAPEPPEGQP